MSSKKEMSPQAQPEPLLRLDRLSAELRAQLDDISREVPIDEGGGASLTKLLVLASLIVAHNFQRVAEIGVYRGRVFLALGATMRALGRGEVTGIDPYTAEAAIQRDDHNVVIDLQMWPDQVDWEGLHAGVLRQVEQRELAAYCRLDRRTSSEAAADIPYGSIELLHVDGNHDRDAVASDLALYLPKMRLGGIVVMDDVTWPSIHPLFEEVAAKQQLILQLYDPGTFSTGDDFGIVRIVTVEEVMREDALIIGPSRAGKGLDASLLAEQRRLGKMYQQLQQQYIALEDYAKSLQKHYIALEDHTGSVQTQQYIGLEDYAKSLQKQYIGLEDYAKSLQKQHIALEGYAKSLQKEYFTLEERCHALEEQVKQLSR